MQIISEHQYQTPYCTTHTYIGIRTMSAGCRYHHWDIEGVMGSNLSIYNKILRFIRL